jgi:hypothetical protein
MDDMPKLFEDEDITKAEKLKKLTEQIGNNITDVAKFAQEDAFNNGKNIKDAEAAKKAKEAEVVVPPTAAVKTGHLIFETYENMIDLTADYMLYIVKFWKDLFVSMGNGIATFGIKVKDVFLELVEKIRTMFGSLADKFQDAKDKIGQKLGFNKHVGEGGEFGGAGTSGAYEKGPQPFGAGVGGGEFGAGINGLKGLTTRIDKSLTNSTEGSTDNKNMGKDVEKIEPELKLQTTLLQQ